ncbi:MAG: hypothetical protein KY468_01110 [Armatimonadetes bacterium]|nr:hypothetical protein [Armatimonadota bacterium]
MKAAYNHGLDDEEAVMAVEQAWLRMKQELENLRRQNEVMSETLHFLQENVQAMEQQIAQLTGQVRRAEAETKEERHLREVAEWEMQQLQQRLNRAVDLIADERQKGWLARLLRR